MLNKKDIATVDKLIALDKDLKFSWKILQSVLENYKYGQQELLHKYEVMIFAKSLVEKDKSLSALQKKIIYLSCILHDIGRYKFENIVKKHTDLQKEHLTGLISDSFSTNKHLKKILKCIQRHSISSKDKPQSIEEKIVFDSDNLTLFTKFGYARWFFMAEAWGGDTSLINSSDVLNRLSKKAQSDSL